MRASVLGNYVVPDSQRYREATNVSAVLCSHVEDIIEYNKHCLQTKFSAEEIHPVTSNTNIQDDSPLQQWRDSTIQNNCISHIALNARVIVTANIKHMARNGDLGIIVGYKMFAQKPEICRIDVLIERTGKTIIFRRSTYFYRAHMGEKFHVATFPLLLGYAITVHRAQGMSLSGILIDLQNGFAPGLAYVAFSRVTDPRCMEVTARSHITHNQLRSLCGFLTQSVAST